MDIEKIRRQIILYNPKMFPNFYRNRRKRRLIRFLRVVCVFGILLVAFFLTVCLFSPSSKRRTMSIIGYAEGQVAALCEASDNIENNDSECSFIMPTMGRISSGFGGRADPFTGEDDFHTGLDIAAKEGTPIYAAASGTVVRSGTQSLAGNYVIIQHANGVKTKYFHCSEVFVSAGDLVTAQTQIAAVGSTGNSTGPHLHFEVFVNDEIVDPYTVLDDNNKIT